MALNYGEGYYPEGSPLDYGEGYYGPSKVEDPYSNITKQTVIEEDSSGTKKTTTIENKTNNPKWRGENQDKVDNRPIPGNDSLSGNYYGDEVALVGDSEIFDKEEFGSFDDNAVVMKHPSGATIKAYSPEEVKLFEQNGYVAPNTIESIGESDINNIFDEASLINDQQDDEIQKQLDHELLSRTTAEALPGRNSRELAQSLHELNARNLAAQTMAGRFIADDMAKAQAEDERLSKIFDESSYMNDMQEGMIQQEYDTEEQARRMAQEFKEADAKRMAQEFKEADIERIAQDQSVIPSQAFDWQGVSKGPMTDAEREEANKPLNKDHEEVNKSEAGKAVVQEFQDRVNKGASPEEEIKKFVSSSGQLKEWRPQLFKAILGTLVGIAAGESFGSAAITGLGIAGEDMARADEVDAEIAKEERKHKRDLELKGIEAGAKALTAKKDLLKSTTKEINSSANNFQQEFFRSMDKDMKEKLNKKIPDVASAYKQALSAYSSKLHSLGITENDLMIPSTERVKTLKRIFDAGMRDWMKAMRAQAQGDEDISISSSPDAFIRARSYHSKLGEDGSRNGNVAPMLLDKQGNLDTESLLILRTATESLVNRSDNYQNADEVFKSLISIWRKLSLEDRGEMTFLEFANSQVNQLK